MVRRLFPEQEGWTMGDLCISVDETDPRRLHLRGDASGTDLHPLRDAAVAVLDGSASELILDVDGVTAIGVAFIEVVNEIARHGVRLRRAVVLEVPDAGAEWLGMAMSPTVRIEHTGPVPVSQAAAVARPPAPAAIDGVGRREGAGFVTSYGPGRRCAAGGCATTLSRYNADPLCWLHSPDTGSRRG